MHTPVLLKESIYFLNPKPGDTILDATINGGGHAREILKVVGEKGRLIGIDQDADALGSLASKWEAKLPKNLTLINGNFREVDKLVREKINGALFDLGMSSNQIESSGRGFSFKSDEPLLMNYGQDNNLTAGEILNKWSEKDISDVLFRYGEERYGQRIAKNIVRRRPVRTTFELVDIIRESVPKDYRNGRINCATRTFQALRIVVNDEINALKQGIEKVWKLLLPGSRLVIISFHSLEDREVKNFFRELKNKKQGIILTKKPITPTMEEKKINSRSRSAKLRAIESAQGGQA
ncbi:MAG: 16S rRNA (cytosine(1402)-N(4))-methyltransferase RsmH [Candidatus Parcubacteria bacterium]|nr:16S rRNA (cytosine(1402)-N(4))-methyltransferase RsmH [Candidatus Parcubacteria bacterium]